MMVQTRDAKPTLVLGGTGKTGRRVAARLDERGWPVRIGSRSAEPRFDWQDPETWGPALDGVRAVYVSFHPDLAVPGAVETVGSFADAAVQRGVSRLVLLAARGEPESLLAEQAVRAAGAQPTLLQSSWFMQNFSEDFLLDGVRGGRIALPAGTTPEPFVDADDIADVAVAALTEDRHAGRRHELSGPRLMTFADAAGELARASGREIRYEPVTLDQHAAAAVEQGVPPEFVELLTHLFRELLDGRNAHTTDGIQAVLGREPRDFADYARDAAATGVWNAPAVTA